MAFSEYGAAIWCEPSAWLSEAHRLLRPGGHLIFLANRVLAMLCALEDEQAVSETLQRPELDQARLLGGQLQVELREPFAKISEEPLDVATMLEAHHEVVSETRSEHVSRARAGAPDESLGSRG